MQYRKHTGWLFLGLSLAMVTAAGVYVWHVNEMEIQHKKQNHVLRVAVDGLRDCVAVTDSGGIIRYQNASFREYLLVPLDAPIQAVFVEPVYWETAEQMLKRQNDFNARLPVKTVAGPVELPVRAVRVEHSGDILLFVRIQPPGQDYSAVAYAK